MVLFGRNRFANNRLGARRIGQAVPANAMQQPQMAAAQQQGIQFQAPGSVQFEGTLQPGEAGYAQEQQGLTALEQTNWVNPETTTLAQMNALGMNIEAGVQPNGTAVELATQTGAPTGAQAQALIEYPQIAQAPAPAAVSNAQCEFPAQSVNFQRNVAITNTPPQITNVDTDICGNVVSFTEEMTRTMSAGPWVATNPAQLQQGAYGVMDIEQQGSQYMLDNTGDYFLNGTGVSTGETVTMPQDIGGARRRQVGGYRVSNRNAAFGAQKMRSWRGP